MGTRPRMRLSGIVLDAPDAPELAGLYRRLLGWGVADDEPCWVVLRAPDGGPGLSFQTEAGYARPTWPTTAGEQQMMVHLDIEVDDLDDAAAHAEGAGAEIAPFQPQDHVRV